MKTSSVEVNRLLEMLESYERENIALCRKMLDAVVLREQKIQSLQVELKNIEEKCVECIHENQMLRDLLDISRGKIRR